jgi:hypothetical protein
MQSTAAVSQRLVAQPLRASTGRVSLERVLADVRAGIGGAGSRQFRKQQNRAAEAIGALNDAADLLERNTAVLVADHTALASQVEPLRKCSTLLAKLDEALAAANAPDEVVAAARRRRLDLDTHFAVVLQAIAALSLLELTNRELLVALRRASATATAALRSASAAAEATGALDLVDRSELRRIAALQRCVDELRAAAEMPDA